MLSEEMLNEIRKNCATNGRLIAIILTVIGLNQSLMLSVVLALLGLCAAYLSDFMALMRVAALGAFFGFVSFLLTAFAVLNVAIVLLT